MMLRFLPDTLEEALLRPLAMAAPNAGVYVEIMAPDARFLLLTVGLLFFLIILIAGRRPILAAPPALLKLLIFTFIAFIPWLVTSGNGRYFILILLLVAPVLVGLIRALSTTPQIGLTLAIGTIGLQAFLIQQSSPWQSWGLLGWSNPPYFHIQAPYQLRSTPATFVTASNISYSILAPQFSADASWVNIAHSPDSIRMRQFLSRSPRPLYLLMPSLQRQMTVDRDPTPLLMSVITDRLRPYGLIFDARQKCEILPSIGIKKMNDGYRSESGRIFTLDDRVGFWICPLQFDSSAGSEISPLRSQSTRYDQTFDRVERHCPRFFPPGGAASARIDGGELRIYSDTEMKLYVLDDGSVLYKYYRALNPVRIGTMDEVLKGTAVPDCTNIPGRSGLPWNRDR